MRLLRALFIASGILAGCSRHARSVRPQQVPLSTAKAPHAAPADGPSQRLVALEDVSEPGHPAFLEIPGSLRIGMNTRQFLILHQGLKSLQLENQWQRLETVRGLEGMWAFQFKNGKLDWYNWSTDIRNEDVNEATFKKCLTATRALIADFTNRYGKPASVGGNAHFIDPMKRSHTGYVVTFAIWNIAETSFRIRFEFEGGKGEYWYLVEAAFESSGHTFL
jgi:hypothetical protein